MVRGRDWNNQCFLFLGEGLHHLSVRAQTKQIKTQTVWSADCGWALKICWQDKQVVIHVLIAQQCYPEAVGWLVAPGRRAGSKGGLPTAVRSPGRGRFPLLTASSHRNPEMWDFPLHAAKNHTADNRTKASQALRYFPASTHMPHRSEK